MSMLLTISQPPRIEFDGRFSYEFSPRLSAKSRVLSYPKLDRSAPSLQASSTALVTTAAPESNAMANSHRGLPPPAAMGLPEPNRQPPLSQPLASLPAPPSQWPGRHDDLTREWYMAKAEEQKRLQEGEKTRQEELRLEQRRVEYSILREALQAGIPPSMIPMIYAGIGGANLASVSIDHLHQYATQLQTAQQQVHHQQQASPELRRETRQLGQAPNTYAAQPPPQVVPSQHVETTQQGAPIQTTFSAYQPAPRTGPTSAPRSAAHAQLPRLTTNEMYVHPPAQQGSGSAHPLQQSQNAPSDPPSSSPSIYFHHWVPPTDSKSTQPPTPASRGEPHSAHPGSHLSESDYKESPRKRKAQGGHQPTPAPTTGPQRTSPAMSTVSTTSRKGGRDRAYSRTSTVPSDTRPDSRRGPEISRASQSENGRSSRDVQRRSRSQEEPRSQSSAASSGEREGRPDRPVISSKPES